MTNRRIVEQLRKLCRPEVVMFSGFGAYAVEPNICSIVTRPQRTFRPEQLYLPRQDSDNWLIHDIKIGHRSQFAEAKPVPGAIFTEAGIDVRLRLDVLSPALDFEVRVEYVGNNPEGEIFRAALIGATEGAQRMVLPIVSGIRVLPVEYGKRFLLELDGEIYEFREHKGLLHELVTITSRPVDELITIEPRTVALHLASTGAPRVVFWASDEEASGLCVFEVGDTLTGGFESRCDLAGYTPTWLAEEQPRDLLISRLTPDIAL